MIRFCALKNSGRFCGAGIAAVVLFFCSSVGVIGDNDLLGFSIEELMQIDVTLVSRKAESLQKAPAAVFVITNEDIHRSGVTSVPEALRLVPGVHVARIDANKWAISARGINGRFSRHMLVQIDGRTVYTPLFSGVLWEAQDVMLEDIDRIEVVRGPGGTMWGANAVNGVINIVTKSAKETQGSLLATSVGTEYRYGVAARHGAALGDNAWLRVYAKTDSYDSGRLAGGGNGHDDWTRTQAGFRMDWEPSGGDTLTLQGDYYEGDLGQVIYMPCFTLHGMMPLEEEPSMEGGNILLRWGHKFSEESTFSMQVYYDYIKRDEFAFGNKQDTFDVDIQHGFKLGELQEITWGGGYRVVSDDIRSSEAIVFVDPSQREEYASLFVQDEISVMDELLSVTVGTKVEHNRYTDIECQPNLRMTYSATERSAVWAAVSRAVRTPSRSERTMDMLQIFPENFLAPGSPFIVGRLDHSDSFDSESMIAYEVGYRANILPHVTVDLAAFVNDYDNLRSVEAAGLSPDGVLHATLGNEMKGISHGFEIAGRWQVLDWWRLAASWSYARLDIDLSDSSNDIFGEVCLERNLPENQVSLFSNMQLPGRIEFDGWFRYVDNIDGGLVPAYTTLDLRLGWKASENIELSLVGQGLLDRSIQEFAQSAIIMTELTEVERSVYAKITVRF